MGTDESPNVFGDDDEEEHAGYKTGTSTPGYRQEGGKSIFRPFFILIFYSYTVLALHTSWPSD